MKRQPPPSQTRPQPETCTLLVQAIQTQWSKAARGGVLATARNRVPEALRVPLPVAPRDEPYYLVHHVIYAEGDDFKHPRDEIVDARPAGKRTYYGDRRSFYDAPRTLQVNKAQPEATFGETLQFDRLHLYWKGDSLAISYRADDREYGVPGTAHSTLNLAGEQWARIQYNLRYAAYESRWWFYEKWIFNVGLFRNPKRNVFLRTEPDAVLSRLSRLR